MFGEARSAEMVMEQQDMQPGDRLLGLAGPPSEVELDCARLATDESPQLVRAYDAIPVLEQTMLPRGGVSVETKAVGRIQVSGWVIMRKFGF